MLNYNIKGTGIEITDELRTYSEKALAQAEKFLSESAHADVELEYSQMRDGDHYRAEFTVENEGAVYRAEEWGASMHAAIDLVIEELLQELRQSKNRRIHFVRRSALKVKEYLRGWRRSV